VRFTDLERNHRAISPAVDASPAQPGTGRSAGAQPSYPPFRPMRYTATREWPGLYYSRFPLTHLGQRHRGAIAGRAPRPRYYLAPTFLPAANFTRFNVQ